MYIFIYTSACFTRFSTRDFTWQPPRKNEKPLAQSLSHENTLEYLYFYLKMQLQHLHNPYISAPDNGMNPPQHSHSIGHLARTRTCI